MAARLAIAFACALAAAFPTSAASVDVRAGRLIDPDSGKVLTDQRIRIVDGKIASVNLDGGRAHAVARLPSSP